jgi:glycosyltransferase involved in cell wall biosynthesis
MRIVYVVNTPRFFLTHRLPVAQAARAAGYEVHVAGPDGPEIAEIAAHGLAYHRVPLARSSVAPLQELRTIRALHALYTSLQPGIVHHITLKAILYGSVAARLARVPAIVNAVTGLGYLFASNELRARVLRRIFLWIAPWVLRGQRVRTIFQNPDDRDLFVAASIVRSDASVVIRGSGVDVAAFSPSPEPEGVPMVALASRMLWDKGVGEFVDAAGRLRDSGVRARFVLVGETDPGNPSGIPVEQLRAWTENGTVEWWGHQQDMPGVLARAAIVALPSTYREGVPKVLLEAAAAGRPIVTTDTPGCREVVRDGMNGFLVPPGDAVALASALHELLRDGALRKRLGGHGRAIAESEFSIETVVTKTLNVYRELLN